MNTETRVTRSRARCTGEELAKGIQSERKAAKPASLTLNGFSDDVPRPVLVNRLDTSNLEIKVADMVLSAKKAHASAPPQKDSCEVDKNGQLGHSKTDGAELFMPATPTQQGLTPEGAVDGAGEAPTAQQLLLQEAAKLTLEEQSGITPARLLQPTPANTPVGASVDAIGKPMPEPSTGSRLSVGMRLEEEMMLTPLDDDLRRELARNSFMAAAAEAIAQAAAYPGLQPKGAAQPQKLAATLASVIVSGDLAAANRAPAPEQADADGAVEDAAPKETEIDQTAPCEKKHPISNVSIQADNRTTAEIQRDLKSAIRMKRAAKKAPSGAPIESSAYPGVSPADAASIQDDASSALCSAMGELGFGPEAKKPLRGQPLPQGRHTRFSESGGATDSPTGERVLLRGVAAPSGAHLRFEAPPEK